jgi:hypothetical protein
MKTRTLLLLALGCGLMIMVAGAVFLFQLAGQDDVAPPSALGEPVEIGDMTVVVEDSDERAGLLAVVVTIGGVDDVDGVAGFRLIASGRPVSPEPLSPDSPDDGCSSTTVEARSCVIRFDVGVADGSSRILFYDRGDAGARWVLG